MAKAPVATYGIRDDKFYLIVGTEEIGLARIVPDNDSPKKIAIPPVTTLGLKDARTYYTLPLKVYLSKASAKDTPLPWRRVRLFPTRGRNTLFIHWHQQDIELPTSLASTLIAMTQIMLEQAAYSEHKKALGSDYSKLFTASIDDARISIRNRIDEYYNQILFSEGTRARLKELTQASQGEGSTATVETIMGRSDMPLDHASVYTQEDLDKMSTGMGVCIGIGTLRDSLETKCPADMADDIAKLDASIAQKQKAHGITGINVSAVQGLCDPGRSLRGDVARFLSLEQRMSRSWRSSCKNSVIQQAVDANVKHRERMLAKAVNFGTLYGGSGQLNSSMFAQVIGPCKRNIFTRGIRQVSLFIRNLREYFDTRHIPVDIRIPDERRLDAELIEEVTCE